MKEPKRIVGATENWDPIWEPRRSNSATLAAAGAGKTTSFVVPAILSKAHTPSHCIVITDGKSGEISGQLVDPLLHTGRKIAIIDDENQLGDHPCKVRMEPFAGILNAQRAEPGRLIFATDSASKILIPEPPDRDDKNLYWRQTPRGFLEFGMLELAKNKPEFATPGGLWVLASDPRMMLQLAEIAQNSEGQHAARARDILESAESTPELFTQHRAAAVEALRPYAEGSVLHDFGIGPTHTYEDLVRGAFIVFIVGDQRNMSSLGSKYGLHLNNFLDAMYAGAGGIEFILDECTNTPVSRLVGAITTMRGYGGSCAFVGQSLSEMQRVFGQKETETILENSLLKQYLGFSSYEEAERVSKAIGEEQVLQTNLGVNMKDLTLSTSYSSGREPIFTPDALMRMPNTHQLLHVKGVGWIYCRKVAQHQISPWCYHLAPNPLEGPQRPPDPKITINM